MSADEMRYFAQLLENKHHWDIHDANMFLKTISALLSEYDLTATIVGSVKQRGFSTKDLDIFVEPKSGIPNHELVGGWIYNVLVPAVSGDEKPSDPNPYTDDIVFVNIGYKSKSIDIFYKLADE
jgi:hypothetical protein